MNNKAFTLVELLAVIVILSLLALITSTAITNIVSDSKKELSDTQMALIKTAAKTWGSDNVPSLPQVGSCSYLTLQDLKDYGLLDENINDPKANEEISNDLKIKITATSTTDGNKIIDYEVNPESINGCTNIY